MILREKLPIENYELFKYVVEFLVQVGCDDVSRIQKTYFTST